MHRLVRGLVDTEHSRYKPQRSSFQWILPPAETVQAQEPVVVGVVHKVGDVKLPIYSAENPWPEDKQVTDVVDAQSVFALHPPTQVLAVEIPPGIEVQKYLDVLARLLYNKSSTHDVGAIVLRPYVLKSPQDFLHELRITRAKFSVVAANPPDHAFISGLRDSMREMRALKTDVIVSGDDLQPVGPMKDGLEMAEKAYASYIIRGKDRSTGKTVTIKSDEHLERTQEAIGQGTRGKVQAITAAIGRFIQRGLL